MEITIFLSGVFGISTVVHQKSAVVVWYGTSWHGMAWYGMVVCVVYSKRIEALGTLKEHATPSLHPQSISAHALSLELHTNLCTCALNNDSQQIHSRQPSSKKHTNLSSLITFSLLYLDQTNISYQMFIYFYN